MADDLKADLVKCLANSDVIVAGDEAWPDAIKRWTNYRAQVPAAVVQPTGEQDVIAAVRNSRGCCSS
ncbi:hypothetical protein BDW74DRAFT_145397 [Aspergillus multicolor]|uniref:uncharacterized protein n=1 Tax=Aspergillus multicolor TaxID=41759 RepID=UPI003CCE4B33